MKEKIQSAITNIALTGTPFQNEALSPTVINFVYGKNGTGKTSISRAIRDGVGLTWKPSEPESEYVRLVFNRDYIEKNIQMHDRMQGIFTIGEDGIKALGDIKVKQEEKNKQESLFVEAKEKIKTKNGELFVKKTVFTEACWNISKTARTFFKQALRGYLSDSKKLADYILGGVAISGKRVTPVDHGYEELKKLQDLAYNTELKRYLSFNPVDETSLPECELLEKVITNSGDTPFAEFIKLMGASSWLKEGHEHYHDDDGRCPYCMQLLPDAFEESFASCFDEQYKKQVSEIENFLEDYRSKGLAVHKALTENSTDCFPAAKLDEYKQAVATFVTTMQQNLDLIRGKIKDPAKKVTIQDISADLKAINVIIASINEQIKENNDAVSSQGKKQSECTQYVWEQLLFDLDGKIKAYHDEKAAIEGEIKSLGVSKKATEDSAKAIDLEITELSKNSSNTKEAIVSINTLLRDAGFQGFELREKENDPHMYELIRDNKEPAKNLSEGEVNFIAFLYFYHMVYGSDKAENVSKKKIVVIDDPVSSLDSDVLFIVGALVRDLIEICRNNVAVENEEDGKEDFIKQIFIFTHNAYFHQEVAYNEEPNWEYVSFFLVSKEETSSRVDPQTESPADRPSQVVNKNPVKNTYAALWDEYDQVKSPVALLNVMRRILEYYFLQICRCDCRDLNDAILVKNKHKLIIMKPDGTEDRRRYVQAKAMLSYLAVNRIGMTDGIHYVDAMMDIKLCKKTFEDIFDYMGQRQHYEKMIGWKNRGDENEEA